MNPKATEQLEWLGKLEKFNDLTGNRDLIIIPADRIRKGIWHKRCW
jgi:hypothetical protein